MVEVEDRHFWFRARNSVITAAFEGVRAGLDRGYRVLEVGCGTGNVLAALETSATGGSITGMDLELSGLLYAKHRVARAGLVAGDAAHPPFHIKFDVIGAFDVIEHIDDDVEVLRHLGRLLTPGGTLMLTVPASPALWSYFDVAALHRRRYRRADLREKLRSAGYSIEYLTPFMTALYPFICVGLRFMSLSRSQSRPDPAAMVEADLKVRPLSGAALQFLLRQEVRAIRSRLTLPGGTSLLAVARRP